MYGNDSFHSALKVYLRAARAFLGVPKPTPIPGILSELNLLLPQYKTQVKMIRQYHRILKLPEGSLTKKVYLWDKNLNDKNLLTTWNSEIKSIFSANNLVGLFESGSIFDLKQTIGTIQKSMMLLQQRYLETQCHNKPKLRTFVTFKDFETTRSNIKKPL